MKNGLYVDENGTQEWYLNEVRHRVDGPAYEEANGDREWLFNGLPHRSDGPAVEYVNAVNQAIVDADNVGGKTAVLNKLNQIKSILQNAPYH